MEEAGPSPGALDFDGLDLSLEKPAVREYFVFQPRSFFGSFGYEAKHLAMLATVAWFLNKIFGPLAVVVWVAGSYFMDWILKKYDTP